MGIFLSSGNRKKRHKGKQNATEQDSHQTMTTMTAMEGTCRLAARINGNQTESRVEMKRDETR